MRNLFLYLLLLTGIIGCKQNEAGVQEKNVELNELFEAYYEEALRFYPLEATAIGDPRYNNRLNIEFTAGFRQNLKEFYSRYLNRIQQFDREQLKETDRINYDVFKGEMELYLQALQYKDNLIPFHQFWGLPLAMGQLGSGDGSQPFKTVKDYDDWLQRGSQFGAWADSAIIYFNKGIAANYVLPKALVLKMIPQMQAMHLPADTASLFYQPIKKIPAAFSNLEKERLAAAYKKLINEVLFPSYKKLEIYLKSQYLPHARNTSGIDALPEAKDYYQFLIKDNTTTNLSAQEIYEIGLSEVGRIRKLQDSIKNLVGFEGSLQEFFTYMESSPKFKIYKSESEIINAFKNIHKKIQPNLKKMFNNTPKTPFEIRQTEAYRAASASAEYNAGSPDGTRPGIFYVPILKATEFNATSGMESLFLHEAIPGHHYQISLQQEDTTLPRFRRFGGNNAYVEGWALYCESLGKELGLYTDPYQYVAALGDEIHRAIRLVVDVGLHQKQMTREEAIKYMMANEAASQQYATMEIERYMAIPGQALGYKIGALKIIELRNKYAQQLGNKFNLAEFHDNILKDGALPLDILERKMDHWANQKQQL